MRKRHEKEVSKLQKLCKHINHHRARYMWAIGHFAGDVEVCDFCGKILEHFPLDINKISKPPPLEQDKVDKAIKMVLKQHREIFKELEDK